MATANFTRDEQKLINVGQLLCSSDLTAGLHSHLTFLSVLNSFLSVTAFLENALALIALHKVSSLHPPSKLLLRSLATTDLCVGLFSGPVYVASQISVVNKNWNNCRIGLSAAIITGSMLCIVSLMTMTAISVDRLLALLLGLRYRQVVTLKRTYLTVTAFWLVSTASSAMYFWNLLFIVWYWIIAVSLCLVALIFSYTKIFFTLRHHQNQVQDHVQQPNQTNQLNIARYRKSLSIAIWLQLTLVVCYLPQGVAATFLSGGVSASAYRAWYYTTTLVLLNSSLNPILYC